MRKTATFQLLKLSVPPEQLKKYVASTPGQAKLKLVGDDQHFKSIEVQ
jgi:hypothetical protein